jgi:beta-phosphoglucomutase-like phosphatase (HAD superfamily)
VHELGALSVHWRAAFDTAEDALAAAGRCGPAVQFPPDELGRRARRLLGERADAQDELEAVAKLTHDVLHRRLTGPRATVDLIGLDRGVSACVFDLDGVLTPSAALHASAWEEAFDEILGRHHEAAHGDQLGPYRPFDRQRDYFRYIHGKPRIEGVHAFLASRGIRLPEGLVTDAPGRESAYGIANRKNEALRRRLDADGVAAFDGSMRFLEVAREAGLRCAVASASANTGAILQRAGLGELVDELVDGRVISAEHLSGKPAPDWILAACDQLGVDAGRVATFETTGSGVAAGLAAGARQVLVVDRSGREAELLALGASRVVSDLGQLIDPSLG